MFLRNPQFCSLDIRIKYILTKKRKEYTVIRHSSLVQERANKWHDTFSWSLCHCENVPGKSGRKENRTRFFLSFQWKISGASGTSEKEVRYFRTECFKGKFVYHLLKPIFDTSFKLPQAFFGKRNWFMQVLLTILEWSLTVLNYHFLTVFPNCEPTGLPM